MNKDHKIARKTMSEYMERGEPFSYQEIQEDIVNRGGILRLDTNYTLGEHIEKLQEEGMLRFDPDKKKFIPQEGYYSKFEKKVEVLKEAKSDLERTIKSSGDESGKMAEISENLGKYEDVVKRLEKIKQYMLSKPKLEESDLEKIDSIVSPYKKQ